MPRALPGPTREEIDLGAVLGALADPARRAVMAALYRGPEPVDCSAATWTARLGISAPTISHHFRVLREAGLTHTEIDGHVRTVRTRAVDLEARFPGLLRSILESA